MGFIVWHVDGAFGDIDRCRYADKAFLEALNICWLSDMMLNRIKDD